MQLCCSPRLRYGSNGALAHPDLEQNEDVFLLGLEQRGTRASPSVLFQLKPALQEFLAFLATTDPSAPLTLEELAETSALPACRQSCCLHEEVLCSSRYVSVRGTAMPAPHGLGRPAKLCGCHVHRLDCCTHTRSRMRYELFHVNTPAPEKREPLSAYHKLCTCPLSAAGSLSAGGGWPGLQQALAFLGSYLKWKVEKDSLRMPHIIMHADLPGIDALLGLLQGSVRLDAIIPDAMRLVNAPGPGGRAHLCLNVLQDTDTDFKFQLSGNTWPLKDVAASLELAGEASHVGYLRTSRSYCITSPPDLVQAASLLSTLRANYVNELWPAHLLTLKENLQQFTASALA